MNQLQQRQSGFTLVEIAIVLVIIGLLLGGVLKGQELINSAKVKNMVGDFRTVSSMVYGYQDRFKAFPGDQTQAQLDLALGAGVATACTPAAAGLCAQNNGRIDGAWNAGGAGTGVATDESSVFWQHTRLANLATGATALNSVNFRPRNADGGFIGIESGISPLGAAAPYIANMRGSFFICSAGILGRYVRQIDSTMDDGLTDSGSVQAVLDGSARGTAPVATNAIVDGSQYTVCAAY
ncbi:MAG: prepilin-type N-terminal cleavage/methylation domain-containing protein [Candidatus Accumulibacter sp.]|uniref:prepilin-type N-terminal cleavage/methylation domain-containing protein n=1 Tax=Accumulibacter sp. TaxID=2053492 RepID=UPI0019F78ACA|nr:prepilin-type N-terminal cleavage/methylation domain-containing protein [Accumulibacter sp.]MBE2257718.1 prepilin-type N-terminal cleavage/methylation domain-containing protein [Paracoccaceae bacterium]MCB1941275.1 prepilin-type N-terminal cleavage/methylation domain-containing protein [Accumulibacter sp.]MCP5249343.1 prepilin-type N-terminal cleavage/methylation domain-containing protein [Accumulibacter sp.]